MAITTTSATYTEPDSACPAGVCLECPLPQCRYDGEIQPNGQPAGNKAYVALMRRRREAATE